MPPRPWRLGPARLRGRRLPPSEALALWRALDAEQAKACRWRQALGRLGCVPLWAEAPEWPEA